MIEPRPVTVGVLVFTLSGCLGGSPTDVPSKEPVPVRQVAQAPAGSTASRNLRSLIAALIDGRDTDLGALPPAERAELDEFYRLCGNAPAWEDSSARPTPDLRDALTLLKHSRDDALDPKDYFEEQLARLMPAVEMESATLRDLARVEVLLSAGVLRYLRDVHIGRIDPRAIGYRLDTPRDQHDFAVLLHTALAEHRVARLAADLRPPLAQYQWLQEMLPRYRSLEADGTFVAPQLRTSAVHPGEPYTDVEVLQRDLAALGDLTGSAPYASTAGLYEGPVVEGVKRFQSRHGLESDGVLGKRTIAALRVPPSHRVRQIELALERLRWLPHLESERLIVLNIPMFRMWAWDLNPSDATPRFGMDVIVGRALRTQTPVFAGEMREVIFRPYWNVPRSILRHEVLPKIEEDPDYLRREDMEIVRGAGDDAKRVDLTGDALAGLKRGVLRIRQRPGPRNALGLIKFVLPNQDDVYMHGTPEQALFARNRRDFSHGCVRVADPVALAEWVLKDRPEWTRERILATTMGVETIHVALPRSIQVILFYTTAAVMPEDGTIHFAEDIYRYDARLDHALAARTAG
jgi:murein L,D-transpeptidase YcbB/YkuD